jgi:hypothetical protein
MNEEKIRFLKSEFIPLLQRIPPQTQPSWGKMSLQHMVEHLTGAVKIASGRMQLPGQGDPALQEKSKAFLMTDKPFRENTRNPFLAEETYPLRNHTLAAAISELQAALLEFFTAYEEDPHKRVHNLVFGDLNYAEQVQLLHKHALHHLKQFGVEPPVYS